MRLLRRSHNKDDFEMINFFSDDLPPYAILSHTWTDGQEVTYQEFLAGTGKHKAGYSKIQFCGEQAAKDGIEYFWVDTCCIDKSSSAELSESINSMYRWYQRAEICYAYIEDWSFGPDWDELASILPDDGTRGNDKQVFASDDELDSEGETGSQKDNSTNLNIPPTITQPKAQSAQSVPLRWFTRGWTLQELIAPAKMEFFDGNQKSRGKKSEAHVIENLTRITGIASSVLQNPGDASLRSICHGQRMSWASYRQTSRKEDIAYCLLGIFDINMPLLYGEGMKAFIRLQEMILVSSTDLSLLAWAQIPEGPQEYRGIFAYEPHEFRALRQCWQDFSPFSPSEEIIMTNRGARMETSLFQLKTDGDDSRPPAGIYILSLGCYIDGSFLHGILLNQVKDFFVRAIPGGLVSINSDMTRTNAQTIYLARDFTEISNIQYDSSKMGGLEVKIRDLYKHRLEIVDTWPSGYLDALTNTFAVGGLRRFAGYLQFSIQTKIPEPETKHYDHCTSFVVVIDKAKSGYRLVNILKEKDAERFKDDIRSISKMDSKTAHRELAKRLKDLRAKSEPILQIYDHANDRTLHLTAEILNNQDRIEGQPDFGRPFNTITVSLAIINT